MAYINYTSSKPFTNTNSGSSGIWISGSNNIIVSGTTFYPATGGTISTTPSTLVLLL